jgi:hypothetical protein
MERGQSPSHCLPCRRRWINCSLNSDTEYLKHWIGVRCRNLQGTRRGGLGLIFGATYIRLSIAVGSWMIIHARCLRAVGIKPGSNPYARIHHFHIFRHLGSFHNKWLCCLDNKRTVSNQQENMPDRIEGIWTEEQQ